MKINGKNYEGFIGQAAMPEKNDAVSVNERLSFYKKKMASGEILDGMEFTESDKFEGLFVYDGDIKIVMPLVERYKEAPHGDRERFAGLSDLKRSYAVKVVGVDENMEQPVVTVSFVKAQDELRPYAIREIDEALARGEETEVNAIVNYLYVDSQKETCEKLYLDILGLNISGRLMCSEWADCYVSDLRAYAKRGDVIPVRITGKDKVGEHFKRTVYHCSRKKAVPSMWSKIDRYLKLNANVRVKCVAMKKGYFLGVIDGIPDMSCVCLFPKTFEVKVGREYYGYVSTLRPEEKILRVQVKEEVVR